MSDLEHDDDESRCWRCQDRIEALEAALRDYHFALDSRKNGDVAADNLRRRIEEILGMPWEQGVEMKRRKAKGGRDE